MPCAAEKALCYLENILVGLVAVSRLVWQHLVNWVGICTVEPAINSSINLDF